MEFEKLYTTAEVCSILNVSGLTVRRYIKDGKLKSKKIGRLHRIPEYSVRMFLDTGGKPHDGSDGHE
jgi:excisionase family DNA binding protein